MIRLTPTKKPDAVMMYCRGDGLLRRCAGGYDVDLVILEKFIEESPATFLIASEDGLRGLGFVMLNPEKNGAVSIHLCLRTKGDKTKKIVALALQYARFVMGFNEVNAIYPAARKALTLLAAHFGFRNDPNLKTIYPVPGDQPYAYQSLNLA